MANLGELLNFVKLNRITSYNVCYTKLLREQRLETLNSNNEIRTFMLHYNFPPYSVGEVKRPGGPSRRDIGHGNLAHRALSGVIPPHDEFEYTIRLVGEVMESNGSSSMGTVCSGCLALMDVITSYSIHYTKLYEKRRTMGLRYRPLYSASEPKNVN